MNKELQEKITPAEALERLLEGNKRFTSNLRINRHLMQEVIDTKKGQYPFAMIHSCIDSRVPSELVFDLGIGDAFTARVAGNVMNDDVIGSMEFACKIAGAKLIMVLGHTRCGAVSGACDDAKMGYLTGLLKKIKPAIGRVEARRKDDFKSNQEKKDAVAEENVHLTVEAILGKSEILREMKEKGEIDIVGAMYSVETGAVKLI